MYHNNELAPVEGEEVMRADITQLQQVEPLMRDVDAVVHMAGDARMSASFTDVLSKNMVGTYVIYETARLAGVPLVVFASTNHVTGMYERDGLPVEPVMPVRPDTHYGASKAYGEALGRFYADAYNLRVICLRIGSFVSKPTSRRNLATWISERDMAQLTWRSIESDVQYGIYYGISGNSRRTWSLDNAFRELGYAPEDDAEAYAHAVLNSNSKG
jgi:uronate dehydrogenase